jgi:hypothetical protein
VLRWFHSASCGCLEDERADGADGPSHEASEWDALEELEANLDHDESDDDHLEAVGGANLQLRRDRVEQVVDDV